MTHQPDALRLADYLTYREHLHLTFDEAAAELRRLYAVNKKLMDALEEIKVNSPDPTDRSFARHVLKKVEEL